MDVDGVDRLLEQDPAEPLFSMACVCPNIASPMPLAATVTSVVDGVCALAYVSLCVATEIAKPVADPAPCGQDVAAAIFTCALVLGTCATMFCMRYVWPDPDASSWECWRWKRQVTSVDVMVQLVLLVAISVFVLFGVLCLRVELWLAYLGFALAHSMNQVCVRSFVWYALDRWCGWDSSALALP